MNLEFFGWLGYGIVNMIHKSFFICLWIWFSRGVFAAGTDEEKSVSVTEGETVTLNTDIKAQRDNQILWVYRHGSSDTPVAEIYKQNINMFDSNVTFGDRLQMDSQTGSLTIRNIRTTDSGLYKLTIIRRNITQKSFSVTVYAPLQIPVITRDSSNCSSSSSSSSERSSVSRCSLVCSVMDDNNTYSCVIYNPIRNQTTHLDNITQLCHTCAERMQPSQRVGISVSLVILLAVLVVAAAIIFFFRRKRKQAKQAVQSCEEEVLYAETTFRARCVHNTKDNGEDHIIYSGVNVT
ncbi:hypothetical protein R3I93_016975 [Phoxinus phoxinus]|uniref:Immunoglobulin domain-containing protein n=1 Tax=Phoxinus phoxinus TaxID=58324 RepID=A0AAN9CMJ5_9TELE